MIIYIYIYMKYHQILWEHIGISWDPMAIDLTQEALDQAACNEAVSEVPETGGTRGWIDYT